MLKDIHFVSSYVCIKNFLWRLNKENYNLIICYKHNEDLIRFVEDILIDQNFKILIIEEIWSFNINILWKIKYLKKITRELINEYKNFNDVYFYCDTFIFSFFVMIDILDSFGRIRFIDSEPQFRLYPMHNKKDIVKKILVRLYSQFLSIKIDYINIGKPAIKWVHDFEKQEYDVPNWDDISKKFNYLYTATLNHKVNVLYIHVPLDLDIYDKEKTKNNLVDFIEYIKGLGYGIYIKDHPGSNENTKYLEGLIEREQFIPAFVPVELIKKEFDFYVTFYSTGIKPFLNEKCYTLYNFIEFYERDTKIQNLLNDNLYGIKYLKNFSELNRPIF